MIKKVLIGMCIAAIAGFARAGIVETYDYESG